MLRTKQISGFCSLTLGSVVRCEYLEPNKIYTQCIRWKRKPIWLPTAKSKVFRVATRPKISHEEDIELQRLNNNYRTYMKSLKNYFEIEYKEGQIQFNEEVVNKAAEEDFIKCSLLNNEWNMRVAEDREIRLRKEREEKKELILQKLVKKEKRDATIEKKVTEHIKKLKEEAPTFITTTNIDKAIEEALANVVNHDFAIDLNGNFHTGKYLDTGKEGVNNSNVTNQ
ncbi:hypothetical protein KPH14_009022 [Odynerus spinipes]|uniref:Small ribosomal subunit protein mS26 n=1 Tax=Odynerus spinipes TaxID=1348599 RepID=A0AAD9RPK7_9HYME|nr:hypothetical protein KPH14_009022 [Odynerus spinipes]